MAEVEAREAAPEAIRRLAELMHSDDGRISIACTAILDRDFRKPTVAVGHSGMIGHDLTQLADAEFMAIVAGTNSTAGTGWVIFSAVPAGARARHGALAQLAQNRHGGSVESMS